VTGRVATVTAPLKPDTWLEWATRPRPTRSRDATSQLFQPMLGDTYLADFTAVSISRRRIVLIRD